ncbi:alpha subunit of the translation initiation factor eif2b [Basidiobolus meristosporus CBS 931.73]|uniref:Translation initiation factor eIF2B subunit alpha n=1 Tax=Basidiobolus meristosporus CBS 931.73 TaxID=1314790 RepID=A0A1Y1YCU5_9FUNG|nr:alpha subunit of the translation initiation factor eif2b [Basidiobolus meristosporus CBS 931.73]|eukprot:ORX95753.1 alpha subunit of the translation initiation factor eif2b [Basidiobolus meristosporus CBS 931.73]
MSSVLAQNVVFNVKKYFHDLMASDEDISMPVAAILTLVEVIKQSKASTMSEFMEMLEDASLSLKSSTRNFISLSAGCDLYMRFVTRTIHDLSDFEACKNHLIERGKLFKQKAIDCRQSIASLGCQFIKDDATILIHSYSRVVMLLLLQAASQKKRFKVYVTESRPLSQGLEAAKILRKAGVPTTVILDSAVGYIMEKVDAVIVGAEGVVENGGVINQIGTYQLAIVAKTANKPFYVVAESFKFVRLFPLNQYDLPTITPTTLSFDDIDQPKDTDELDEAAYVAKNPCVDYTPPEYITLLFTDIGVLTPSGVSDELIKLHY